MFIATTTKEAASMLGEYGDMLPEKNMNEFSDQSLI